MNNNNKNPTLNQTILRQTTLMQRVLSAGTLSQTRITVIAPSVFDENHPKPTPEENALAEKTLSKFPHQHETSIIDYKKEKLKKKVLAHKKSFNKNVRPPSAQDISKIIWSVEDLELQADGCIHKTTMKLIPKVTEFDQYPAVYARLSRRAQHLFQVIKNWRYKDCFPTQATLAGIIGCTREWINKLMKQLHRLGFLVKVYRHYSPCLYLMPPKLKIMNMKNAVYSLLDKIQGKFTQDFTPNPGKTKIRTLREAPRVSEENNKKPHTKKCYNDGKIPSWLPKREMLYQKIPFLAKYLKGRDDRWWNLCAFTEQALHSSLSTLENKLHKGSVDNCYRYLMKCLLKAVPRDKQNWSLAGKLKRKYMSAADYKLYCPLG